MGRQLRVVLRTWFTRPLNWFFAGIIAVMLALLCAGTVLKIGSGPPMLHHKVNWTASYSPRTVQLNRRDLEPGVDLASKLRGVRHLEIMNLTPYANGRGGEFSLEPLTRAQLGGLRHGRDVVQLILRGAVAPDAWVELAALDSLQTLVIHHLGQREPIDFRQFPPIPALRCLDLNQVDWLGHVEPLAERNPWIERLVVRDIDLRRRDGRPLDLSELPRGLQEIMINPAFEQTSDPPYIPKWRREPTPTLSAGWKYSAPSKELLEGLARLPGLRKAWLYDLDVRDWGQAEAVAALPGKQVEQVATLQLPSSPAAMIALPLTVFPIILLSLQAGLQFSHPLSRTIPGYAFPHQVVAAVYLLIPCVLGTLAFRAAGANWFPGACGGVLVTGVMLVSMGFAHIAPNPRLGNGGGLVFLAAVFGVVGVFFQFPEVFFRLMAGEMPVYSALAGVIGLSLLALFVGRLPRMASRFEEQGLRNMFAHPFDGQSPSGAGQALANLPANSWSWRWMFSESNPVLSRVTRQSLLATPAEQARLVAAGSGLDTIQILMLGTTAPIFMGLCVLIVPALLSAGDPGFLYRALIPIAPISFCMVLMLLAQRWITRRPQFAFETTHPLSRREYFTALSRAIARQHAIAYIPMVGWSLVVFLVFQRGSTNSNLAFPLHLLVLAGACAFSSGIIQWLITERRQWVRWVVGILLGYLVVGVVTASGVMMMEHAPGTLAGTEDLIRLGLAVALAGTGWGMTVWSRSRWLRTQWGLAGL